MEIRVIIDGAEKLRAKLSDPNFVGGPLRDFLQRAGHEVESEAKQRAPVDTGHLQGSIQPRVSGTQVSIGTPVKYAPYVEFGTRPHYPPPNALQPWARRHGFGPRGHFMLAAIIAKRGTKPHPFLIPGYEAARGAIDGYVEELARDIERNWSM